MQDNCIFTYIYVTIALFIMIKAIPHQQCNTQSILIMYVVSAYFSSDVFYAIIKLMKDVNFCIIL